MFEIDCTVLPQSVTDFVFDHLQDDLSPHLSEQVESDYTTQRVSVDVGNMDDAYTVRNQIQERAYEKINDLKFETEQGYDTGFEVSELKSAQSDVSEIEVQTE